MSQIYQPVNKWHLRYWGLARQWAECSKDPSTHVGAIVVGENGRPLSLGYNGFPRGLQDSSARLNDRETKLRYMVHAEQNCIYNAGQAGVPLFGSTIYVHGCPICHECAKAIIQAGISKAYSAFPMRFADTTDHAWSDSHNWTKSMFDEAGVTYRWLVCENLSAVEVLP